jgi:hypothetical protein
MYRPFILPNMSNYIKECTNKSLEKYFRPLANANSNTNTNANSNANSNANTNTNTNVSDNNIILFTAGFFVGGVLSIVFVSNFSLYF